MRANKNLAFAGVSKHKWPKTPVKPRLLSLYLSAFICVYLRLHGYCRYAVGAQNAGALHIQRTFIHRQSRFAHRFG